MEQNSESMYRDLAVKIRSCIHMTALLRRAEFHLFDDVTTHIKPDMVDDTLFDALAGGYTVCDSIIDILREVEIGIEHARYLDRQEMEAAAGK